LESVDIDAFKTSQLHAIFRYARMLHRIKTSIGFEEEPVSLVPVEPTVPYRLKHAGKATPSAHLMWPCSTARKKINQNRQDTPASTANERQRTSLSRVSFDDPSA
jgi:hypothetical protein